MPSVGRSSPRRIRTSVVLPPPFGPATATNSPSPSSRSTSSSTRWPGRYPNDDAAEARPLATSERLPQRREVRPASRRSSPRRRRAASSAEPLERVENRDLRVRLARDGVASVDETSGSTNTVVASVRSTSSTSSSSSRGLGSASGERPASESCVQAVALREVAERRVARHDHAPARSARDRPR